MVRDKNSCSMEIDELHAMSVMESILLYYFKLMGPAWAISLLFKIFE